MLQVEHRMDETSLGEHHHNAYEIILVLRGRIRLTLRTGAMEVGAGSLIFLSNLESHAVSILEGPYERYFLMAAAQHMDGWIRNSVLLSVFKNRPAGFCNAMDIAPLVDRVRAHFEALLEESAADAAFTEERIRSLLTSMLVLAYRHAPGAFPFHARSSAAVREMQRYLDEHFAEPVSIPALAERFFISPSHLSHLYKRLTGYSPKQYIMLNRLALAYDLLSQGWAVEEAGQRCGFADVNNFIRRFRQRYGVTPGQLRRGQGE